MPLGEPRVAPLRTATIVDHKRARAIVRGEAVMTTAGLVVLLARGGGSATYAKAEYPAVAAPYGGPAKMAINVEVVRVEGQSDEIRLSLIVKPPANAELVVS